jgi:hypothetical protein
VLGGASIGLAAWILSGLAQWVRMDVRAIGIFVFSALALAREFQLIGFPLPERSRQVPQSIFWTRSMPALRFGVELGTGVRTHVTSTAPYLVLLAVVLLVRPPGLALVTGASFGLGRAFMAVSRAASVDGGAWDRRLAERLGWLAPACATVSALALAWASAVAL